jgi:cytochrome c oxidase cbb3-type subunit I/II
MLNPRVTSPGSIMPRYPWLIYNELDRTKTKDKLVLLKNVFGHPYTDEEINNVDKLVDEQAAKIVEGIYSGDAEIKKAFDAQKAQQGAAFVPVEKREIVALIAYLQRLGTDIKTTEVKTASNN